MRWQTMSAWGIGLLLVSRMGTAKGAAKAQPQDFSPVTAQIQQWVSKGYYRGAALVVVHYGSGSQGDRIVYERRFGDYKIDAAAYIASAGKWLVAAAIASVVDQGKLSWDDPASKWLPQITGDKGRATLR